MMGMSLPVQSRTSGRTDRNLAAQDYKIRQLGTCKHVRWGPMQLSTFDSSALC